MIYQTRKQLSEFGDKLSSETKDKVNSKLKSLEDAVKAGEVSNYKDLMDSLQQEVMKMGQALYGQQTPHSESTKTASNESKTEEKKTSENGVIDADFTDSKE